MTKLPTVDQFGSFQDTCIHLGKDARQCIWHLADKGRLCKCKITIEDNRKALELAQSIQKSSLPSTSHIQILANIAELCCCPRHHRSKIHGTGIAQQLGLAWYEKIKVVSTPSVRGEPNPPSPPLRIFAKHQVHPRESMSERICSSLDLEKGTSGSIYFYTHKTTGFTGMIKVGYTCNTITSRLVDWDICGHGYPKLLASICDVRHPERVELLTHFELLEVWHELMWCKAHERTHIEWFKVEIDKAKGIAFGWNQWMHKANPYDRRGKLKTIWKGRCESLQKRGQPITAQVMLRLHEGDVGLVKKEDSVENAVTRKKSEVKVKKEKEDKSLPPISDHFHASSGGGIKLERTRMREPRG